MLVLCIVIVIDIRIPFKIGFLISYQINRAAIIVCRPVSGNMCCTFHRQRGSAVHSAAQSSCCVASDPAIIQCEHRRFAFGNNVDRAAIGIGRTAFSAGVSEGDGPAGGQINRAAASVIPRTIGSASLETRIRYG